MNNATRPGSWKMFRQSFELRDLLSGQEYALSLVRRCVFLLLDHFCLCPYPLTLSSFFLQSPFPPPHNSVCLGDLLSAELGSFVFHVTLSCLYLWPVSTPVQWFTKYLARWQVPFKWRNRTWFTYSILDRPIQLVWTVNSALYKRQTYDLYPLVTSRASLI